VPIAGVRGSEGPDYVRQPYAFVYVRVLNDVGEIIEIDELEVDDLAVSHEQADEKPDTYRKSTVHEASDMDRLADVGCVFIVAARAD
jgi:hypothetical protein